MKIPVWLKPGLLGAACGAIIISYVGFAQLGWKTAASAAAFAQESAESAVVTALVPFCVAKAQVGTEQVALTKFRAVETSFSRTEFVQQAGWAMVGDGKSPNNTALARACSVQLYGMKSG